MPILTGITLLRYLSVYKIFAVKFLLALLKIICSNVPQVGYSIPVQMCFKTNCTLHEILI